MQTILLVLFALIFATGSVFAASNQGENTNKMTQDPKIMEVSDAPAGNAVANQAKTATQNMGEEQQLQIQTQEEMMLQDGEGEGMEEGRISRALNKLEQLKDLKGTLGQELGEIATAQTRAQEKIQDSLTKLQKKSSFAKRLFGPDYQALKGLQSEFEGNQLRIQALQELMIQTENEAEASELQLAIDAFLEQNTSLETQIQEEEAIPSIFGWFARLFNR
jgi:hypothetical protein